MILSKLQSKFPDADQARLIELSEIWEQEMDRIIQRMLDISAESCTALPAEAKHLAVFEMAQLVNFLSGKIVEKKLEKSTIEQVDVDQERAWLDSEECSDRVETTARNFAENIWMQFVDEWWEKYPAVSSADKKAKRRKFAKYRTGVRRQHFSPKQSNKHWADEKNKVRIYRPALDGSVRSELRPMAEWSREEFIYSQSLESLFAAIESDAGSPYKKLLNMVPFCEDDRKHWVAFLIAQIFRTPSFIIRNLDALRGIIERDRLAYATDTASLRRAYETLFINNKVFDTFYRTICGHEWSLWSAAPEDGAFLRGDVPVVIDGSDNDHNWRLIYPMTPYKCFVSGPTPCAIPDVPIPRTRTLDASQLRAINELIAMRCLESAMGVSSRDDSELFSQAFQASAGVAAGSFDLSVKYWGRPC